MVWTPKLRQNGEIGCPLLIKPQITQIDTNEGSLPVPDTGLLNDVRGFKNCAFVAFVSLRF